MGLAEDVTMELSKFKMAFCYLAQLSFTFKGKGR